MTYEITHEQRLELLEAHNNLRRVLQMVAECNDLWLSDVRNMEKLECDLHTILKFKPRKNKDGHSMFYDKWMLDEDDEDDS